MQRIVAGIDTIEQHLEAVRQAPEVYRPPCCPHCGLKILWPHGHHVARLARLRLDEAEEERMQGELNAILTAVDAQPRAISCIASEYETTPAALSQQIRE